MKVEVHIYGREKEILREVNTISLLKNFGISTSENKVILAFEYGKKRGLSRIGVILEGFNRISMKYDEIFVIEIYDSLFKSELLERTLHNLSMNTKSLYILSFMKKLRRTAFKISLIYLILGLLAGSGVINKEEMEGWMVSLPEEYKISFELGYRKFRSCYGVL